MPGRAGGKPGERFPSAFETIFLHPFKLGFFFTTILLIGSNSAYPREYALDENEEKNTKTRSKDRQIRSETTAPSHKLGSQG